MLIGIGEAESVVGPVEDVVKPFAIVRIEAVSVSMTTSVR